MHTKVTISIISKATGCLFFLEEVHGNLVMAGWTVFLVDCFLVLQQQSCQWLKAAAHEFLEILPCTVVQTFWNIL